MEPDHETALGAVDVMSFDDALQEALRKTSKPHVLLGNGFSIACRPDRFEYHALLDDADFSGASVTIKEIFSAVETNDFERIIDLLRTLSRIVKYYESEDPDPANSDLAIRLDQDTDIVRDALAKVLASKHQDRPRDIRDDEYVAARRFLGNFERIYTLNYDMLLYWAMMQNVEPTLKSNDGFRDPDDSNSQYVEWAPYDSYSSQRVFFLHGGLHLYDTGTTLGKMTYTRTHIPLIEQIREALGDGRYPLVVTEGSSEEKLEKVLHNAYLTHAIRSFSAIKGVLFVYGHSLGPSDDHILRRISERKLSHIFVSLHGNPESKANQEIVSRARALATGRSPDNPLSVAFYDAGSAALWG